MEIDHFVDFDMDSQEALTVQLRSLVEIESGSNNGAGNDKVLDIVEAQMQTIGFTTKRILHERDKEKLGKMLVAEYLGKDSKQFFTLIAHADTILAAEKFPGFSIDADQKTAYGPGVIDCKGGVVVVVAALKAYIKQHQPNFSIRFICSPSEETGSKDFHEHILGYGKDTVLGLGYEPGFENGDIVHGRNGNRWYKITCHGRKVHSGREYTHGVNAARALAHKILKLSALTDVEKGSTVCITHATCGDTNYNTMPGVGYIYADTRFGSPEEDKRLEKGFIDELNRVDVYSIDDHTPASMSFEIADYCPAITINEESQPLLSKMKDLIGALENRKIDSKISHGSADCNSLWHKGMVFVGGLGAIGSGMHTVDEKVDLSSLRTRALATAQFLTYADQFFLPSSCKTPK